jgi:hypothetical protein
MRGELHDAKTFKAVLISNRLAMALWLQEFKQLNNYPVYPNPPATLGELDSQSVTEEEENEGVSELSEFDLNVDASAPPGSGGRDNSLPDSTPAPPGSGGHDNSLPL